MDILAQGHYGTGTFRHRDISAHGYFGYLQSNIDISAPVLLCRNVPVPKCSCVKNSSGRKVPMSKCSCVEMSICRNVCSAEWYTCRNVPIMKHPCRNDSCQNVPCRNGLQGFWRIFDIRNHCATLLTQAQARPVPCYIALACTLHSRPAVRRNNTWPCHAMEYVALTPTPLKGCVDLYEKVPVSKNVFIPFYHK